MNLEDQLRDDLHHIPLPAGLAPRADLAGSVLADLRRQRRTRTLVTAAVAVTLALAVGLPVGLLPAGSGTDTWPAASGMWGVTSLPMPTPGGGPQAIHVYSFEGGTVLLDVEAGEYRMLPYQEVVLSPDLTTAAVASTDGRIGVADRAALLAQRESAVHWLDLPPGELQSWSPDGSAVLATSLVKDAEARTVTYTAHRYDLATGTVTDTPIDGDILGGVVGWAADSQRYLVLLPAEPSQPGEPARPGALQYLAPDGTLGERIDVDGGLIGGARAYSPSRTHLLVDASQLMATASVPSKIVELGTWLTVLSLPDRARLVGWYNDTTAAAVVSWQAPGGSTPSPQPTFSIYPPPGTASPSGMAYPPTTLASASPSAMASPSEAPRATTTLDLVEIGSPGSVTARIHLTGLPHPTDLQIGSSEGLTGPAADYGF